MESEIDSCLVDYPRANSGEWEPVSTPVCLSACSCIYGRRTCPCLHARALLDPTPLDGEKGTSHSRVDSLSSLFQFNLSSIRALLPAVLHAEAPSAESESATRHGIPPVPHCSQCAHALLFSPSFPSFSRSNSLPFFSPWLRCLVAF